MRRDDLEDLEQRTFLTAREGGYVMVTKGYRGRKPNTVIALTDQGWEAFHSYRATITTALSELPD